MGVPLAVQRGELHMRSLELAECWKSILRSVYVGKGVVPELNGVCAIL